jgi:hypothetical protein
VTIDGKSFSGKTVSIINGRVIVDGNVQDGELVGEVHVTVEGDVNSISDVNGSVTAHSAGSINVGAGNVRCGDVSGNVQTGSGNIECRNVGGKVTTGSGNIRHAGSR